MFGFTISLIQMLFFPPIITNHHTTHYHLTKSYLAIIFYKFREFLIALHQKIQSNIRYESLDFDFIYIHW